MDLRESCKLRLHNRHDIGANRITNEEFHGITSSGSNRAPETVLTNASIPGQKFQLQRYQNYLGEFPKEWADRHVIAQICQSRAPAERRGATGNWVRHLKERGSLTILPAGPAPDVRVLTPSTLIACTLEKNFVGEIALEMDRRPNEGSSFQLNVRDASIEGLLSLIIHDLEAESQPYALYSETLAHALAMRFLLYESRSEDIQHSSVKPLPPRILRRILDRIDAELHTELSLVSLAKESGYSRVHFLRMFRAATGLTPHQYVLERRLSTAQQLLRQSKMLLADIAVRCGFSSQTHMNDVFRKQLGVTPLEYRRNI
ncbi:MAG TPA: helix-turn-helix domain-containing protein [Acidobacteriaceae bacterium]